MTQLFQFMFEHGPAAAHKGAMFSDDRVYRYALWRSWDAKAPFVNFVLLNPSTADAEVDDPTVTRLMVRAKKAGFGGVVVTNVYGFRSTDPDVVKKQARAGVDVVGIKNDEAIVKFARKAGAVIIGWGKHCDEVSPGRSAFVLGLLQSLGCKIFAVAWNDDGSPRHPLYVPYDLPLRGLHDKSVLP